MVLTSKMIFENVTLICATLCLYYFYLSVEAYTGIWRLKPAGIEIPDIFECWLTPIVSAFLFYIYKRVMMALLLSNLVPFCKDSGELQHKRAEKAVTNISKAIYYTVFTTWAFIILKDSNFYPA